MARRIRWQIVVAVISSLLVGGLLGDLAISTTAVSEPRAGGTYTEAVSGTPQNLIPLLNNPLNDPAGRDMGALLFDGLTRIGVDGLPEGALAERWEVDPTGEVYIFQLRDDVRWHDGEPFTADDVVFTINAIKDEDFPGDPALVNLWSNVLVDRINEYTVRFTLSAPYAPFPHAARMAMLPEHLLDDVPVDEWADSDFARQPIGTGPYHLSEMTSERALLEANIDYFASRPYIDSFELQFVETTQAAIPQFIDTDVMALGASTTIAPELAQVTLPDTVKRLTLPLDEYVILTFNLRRQPLRELVFRQALARGLDKDLLVEQVLNEQVRRIDTPILPGWWPFDSTIGWYEYDVVATEEAFAILDYEQQDDGTLVDEDGEQITLPLITDGTPGRLAAAEEIARQWGDLGIAVEVTELEAPELRQRLQEHDFLLAVHGWARLGADPDVFELWHSSQAADGLNYAGLRDDDIDEMLTKGRVESNLAARNEAYAAFQRRWVELVPGITLYQPLYTFAVSDEVDGIGFEQADIIDGSGASLLIGREDRYRSVRRWFINSSREIRGSLR